MKAADNTIELNVLREFSRTPGPRYIDEGEFSGELFRKNILLPKFKEAKENGCILLIELDGTEGYGTSFLEEAFGGLIRSEGFSYEEINKTVELKTTEEKYLKEDIYKYMKDAEDEK